MRAIAFPVSMALVAAGLIVARPQQARAQVPVPSSSTSARSLWRIAAGSSQLSFRDIARFRRPVDASPVARIGRGWLVDVGYTRAHQKSAHLFNLTAAIANDVAYRTPLATLDRLPDDSLRVIDGQYEYRRYFWSDVGMRGLDVGVGVQGSGYFGSIARHVPVAITSTERMLAGGVALVAATRLHRWSAVAADVSWINGIAFSRMSQHDSESPGSGEAHAGGGWLENLAFEVDVRLKGATALAVRFQGSGRGIFSSHQQWSIGQRSLAVGVTYGR